MGEKKKDKKQRKEQEGVVAAVVIICVLAAVIIVMSVTGNGGGFSLFALSANGGVVGLNEWIIGACYIFLAMILFVLVCFAALAFEKYIIARKSMRLEAKRIMGDDALIRIDPGAKLAYKGLTLFMRQEYEKAAEYFEKALTLDICDDNKAFCFDWLAHCYYRLNRFKEVTAVNLRAVTALPTNDNMLWRYGDCCMLDGSFERAEYYFNLALKYNPNNSEVYIRLGRICMQRGEYDKAQEMLDMALRVNNASLEALLEKAVCYALASDAERSNEMLKRAIACDDVHEAAELCDKYNEKIQRIRLLDKISEGGAVQNEQQETEAEA